MRIYLALGAVIGVLMLGEAPAAPADQNCRLTQYASLALGTDSAGGVYVPLGIDHHAENLLVDTGGVASTLTQSTAEALRLSREPLSGRIMVVMGGAFIREIARADTVQLGNMEATHIGFLVMPDHRLRDDEAGILGPDIMGNYDVELDFAKAKFNLFSADHCPGQVVYWTHEPYAVIPIQMDAAGHISTTVMLDGKSIRAVLDTGSSRSSIGFESASDIFDWNDKTPDLTVTSRQKDGTPQTWHFPFKTLALSGVTVNNPDITLYRQLNSEDFRIGSPATRFLVGMGTLRQLHLYIAYRERNLYVTAADAH